MKLKKIGVNSKKKTIVLEDVHSNTTLFVAFKSNSSYKIETFNRQTGWDCNPRFNSYDEEYIYQYCIDELTYANVNL